MAVELHKLTVAQKTDQGLRRALNEDSCEYRVPKQGSPEYALGAVFLVADGIGSLGGGQHASRAAIDSILDTYYDPELEDESTRERIIAAVQDSNVAVRQKARELNLATMGTTVAGAVILPTGRVYLFNVGDSRIYLLRGGGIQQITADDIHIDLKNSLERAKLTAFLGQIQPVLPNIFEQDLHPGDTLLICSDGLWGLVDPPDILAVVQSTGPQKAVDELVKKVYEQGARDNVTITIIKNSGKGGRSGGSWGALAVAAVMLALAALLAFLWVSQPVVGAVHTDTPSTSAVEQTESLSVHAPQTLTPSPTARISEDDGYGGGLVVHTPTIAPTQES
jgi:PPM family protein phosphatase